MKLLLAQPNELYFIWQVELLLYNLDLINNPCYADKKYGAVINYNGDVFRCTARDFSTKIRDGYLHKDGFIVEENNSLKRRLNSKFKNESCLSCRILPICNGNCTQCALEAIEKKEDYCVLNYDEEQKDKVILDKFLYNIRKNKNWKILYKY